MRWPAGEGEQCKEAAARGEWVVGGWPYKKVVACLVVQPSIRPATRKAGGRCVY